MRFLKSIALAFLFTVIFMPVSVMATQPLHHMQHYEITIEVESVEVAAMLINSLSGYNLDSSVNLGLFRPEAHFRRRVDSWAYRQVQETLRNMGTVLFEFETVTYLGNELLDLEAQLEINSGEIQRVSLMLEQSTSLNVMTMLSDRLGQLTWTRDRVIGRRNQILVQTGSPIIYINLVQTIPPPDEEDEEYEEEEEIPPTFFERLGNSFTSSISGVGNFFGSLLVGFAFVSVPLLVWFLICTPVILFFVRRNKVAKNVKNSKNVAANMKEDAK